MAALHIDGYDTDFFRNFATQKYLHGQVVSDNKQPCIVTQTTSYNPAVVFGDGTSPHPVCVWRGSSI